MAMAQAMATSLRSAAMPMFQIKAQTIGHTGAGMVRVRGDLFTHGLIRLSCVSPRFEHHRQCSNRCSVVLCSVAKIEESSTGKETRFSPCFFHVLDLVASFFRRIRDSVQKPQSEEEIHLLAALKGRMVCAAAPVLFAAVTQSVNTPLTVVASGMAKWLELYSGVLMVRVLLSWFPNIPWERQPLQAMRDMCDPYLILFRNIIPPLFNALDLSPMLAFLVLGVLTSILNTTVQAS